jgi:cytidylate kinase
MKLRQIAIDGTAGAGKSTLGERLAQRFDYLYIDTGAMYRAVTWLALSKGLELHDEPALARLAKNADIVIDRPRVSDGRQYTVWLGKRDITWDIREAHVTHSVPIVSNHPEVRAVLVSKQRAIGMQGNVVMVGRDIGTVVLPDAELKIFLDASPLTRALRRYHELTQRQNAPTGSIEEILQEMLRRDELDRANMEPAHDAIPIMTDDLSALEVLDRVCQKLKGLTEDVLTGTLTASFSER